MFDAKIDHKVQIGQVMTQTVLSMNYFYPLVIHGIMLVNRSIEQ